MFVVVIKYKVPTLKIPNPMPKQKRRSQLPASAIMPPNPYPQIDGSRSRQQHLAKREEEKESTPDALSQVPTSKNSKPPLS
jgi:hypothetical protein